MILSLQQNVPIVDPPRGHFPPFSELFTLTHFESTLAAAGDLLWLVTYILVIREGFKHRTYALPLLAIALNITWEFVYTVIFPSSSRLVFGLHAGWLVIDVIIVYQLLRFGRGQQSQPFFKRHYALLVMLTLAACFAFHVTYQRFNQEITLFPIDGGNGMAFMMNLVMSVLFIGMLLNRKDLRGLSLPVAWTKMLATAMISISNVMTFRLSEGRSFEFQFREAGSGGAWQSITRGTRQLDLSVFYFLFLTIFILDILYIVMLRRARRRRDAEIQDVTLSPAAA